MEAFFPTEVFSSQITLTCAKLREHFQHTQCGFDRSLLDFPLLANPGIKMQRPNTIIVIGQQGPAVTSFARQQPRHLVSSPAQITWLSAITSSGYTPFNMRQMGALGKEADNVVGFPLNLQHHVVCSAFTASSLTLCMTLSWKTIPNVEKYTCTRVSIGQQPLLVLHIEILPPKSLSRNLLLAIQDDQWGF